MKKEGFQMKKIFVVILLLTVLLAFTGCTKQEIKQPKISENGMERIETEIILWETTEVKGWN
jgi:hypothetical protein